MIMKWFMVINNFEISIIPGSTSYELTNWQQNEPQRRRLNVEGEIYIISLFSPLFLFFFRQLWNYSVMLGQVRELVDKATNIVMNYTETEAKVIGTIIVVYMCALHRRSTISCSL